MWMNSGVSLREFVTLEHVQHGSLACVIEAKENNVGTLLEETEPLEAGLEEVYYEHVLNQFNLYL